MGLVVLFAAAFVAALSGAMMPGPVLFATVRWSAQHGRWVGPLMVLGHAVIEVPLMAAVVLGLDRLLANVLFKGAVGVVGGAVLLGMGLLMLRSLGKLELPLRAPEEADPSPLGLGRVVTAGVLTSASNPYFVGWWATIGLKFLADAKPFGLVGYVVFYARHILADLAWYGAVSESVHHGRRFLSVKTYRGLVGVCAVVLIGFALWFGWDGLTGLLRAMA